MTTLQKTLITVTIAAAVGTGIYEARQVSAARTEVETLQRRQSPLADQIQQLQRERDDATNKLAALSDEIANQKVSAAELLKLRGEMARLRTDSRALAQLRAAETQSGDDPIKAEANALAGKARSLKQLFDQMPDQKIPELRYLGAQAWLNAAELAKLDTDAEIHQTLSKLRHEAKQFTAVFLNAALRSYTQANAGRFPTDVLQLKPYLPIELGDDVLQRYSMVKTGDLSNLQSGDMVMSEKSPVDEQYDTLFQIAPGSWSWQGIGRNKDQHGSGGALPPSPPNQPDGK
jgi:hypothetical protein